MHPHFSIDIRCNRNSQQLSESLTGCLSDSHTLRTGRQWVNCIVHAASCSEANVFLGGLALNINSMTSLEKSPSFLHFPLSQAQLRRQETWSKGNGNEPSLAGSSSPDFLFHQLLLLGPCRSRFQTRGRGDTC